MSGLDELFRLMEAESPMKVVYVSTIEQHNAVCSEMETKGLRLAATSNSGLPKGVLRLTFLPAEAFKDSRS